MLKTIIVLDNGMEILSGAGTTVAIQQVTIKESVNDAKELSIGSACANMLEARIFDPNQSLAIAAGSEVTAYKVTEGGTRALVGRFIVEQPSRVSANVMKLTAYDRITKLDKDLSGWLSGLTDWPYSLLTFAQMVCTQCGLTLVTTSIPNGDYMVQKFGAQSVTGRKLMQWVGQIAARFCRATPEGNIELAWYTSSGVTIAPDGDHFYYQNGLSYEKYSVAPIEKVQAKLTADDVGVVWPTDAGEKNTYIITGNYLLTASTTADLQPVVQTIYTQLQGVSYTPCRVVIPACTDIHAGQTVQIRDRNGNTITAYVMRKTQSKHRDTIECTGSQRRDSTTAVNDESYRALSGQILEIKKEVEGYSVAAKRLEELEVGARNLIRNSVNLIYEDYDFESNSTE